jgi:hypothetical protein
MSVRTARIEQLLEVMRQQGYWTQEQVEEIYAMTGRDPGYVPEGTEGWMVEDGVPRSYDKPHKPDTPPPRPAEPAELAAHDKPPEHEVRIAQLEATIQQLYAKVKALEERVIDPSA